jgi:hypothetical protein
MKMWFYVNIQVLHHAVLVNYSESSFSLCLFNSYCLTLEIYCEIKRKHYEKTRWLAEVGQVSKLLEPYKQYDCVPSFRMNYTKMSTSFSVFNVLLGLDITHRRHFYWKNTHIKYTSTLW